MSNGKEYTPVPLPKQRSIFRQYVHLTSKGNVTEVVFNHSVSAVQSSQDISKLSESKGYEYLGRLVRL